MDGLKLEKISDTLSVYQKSGVFCYGTDAVLLANFVKSSLTTLNGKYMCDLCSGTGIIPLLLCDSNNSIMCEGLEINSDACCISEMSADVSGYKNRFKVTNGDVKDVRELYSPEHFDFITCNPPYMTNSSGKLCDADYKTIARHEVLCDINDIFAAAFYLLRTGASIFIVYRSDRLSSLFRAAENNRFQIKKMTAVSTKEIPSEVKLILCEAKKFGNEGLKLSVNDVANLTGKI